MKEIWLFGFGMIFFASMTLYNLVLATKRKGSFIPAIISFLMTLAVFFSFMEMPVLGFLFFIAGLLLAVVKSSKLSKIREEKILNELEKIDCKTSIRINDFLTWKAWAKIIVKYGAKRAALFYTFFVVLIGTMIWLVFGIIYPGFLKLTSWLTYFAVILLLFYYDFSKIFAKALIKVKTNE